MFLQNDRVKVANPDKESAEFAGQIGTVVEFDPQDEDYPYLIEFEKGEREWFADEELEYA